MNLRDMIQAIRRRANQPTNSGLVTDSELAQYVNFGQDMVVNKIVEADEGYFEDQDSSLGFVADQREYDLPERVRGRVISLIERTDITSPVPLREIRFQDRERYARNSLNLLLGSDERFYYLRGQKLGVVPTPDSTIANNLRLSFIRRPAELSYGTVASGTSTTLTLPATPTAGTTWQIDDYYNSDSVYIVSGTGAGQRRDVSDYVGSTRTLTLSSAWSTTPDTTSMYSFISPIPEQYHEILVAYAVRAIHQKDLNRDGIATWNETLGTLLGLLLTSIETRVTDEAKYIRSTNDNMEEWS